jgi:hypothetical protein
MAYNIISELLPYDYPIIIAVILLDLYMTWTWSKSLTPKPNAKAKVKKPKAPKVTFNPNITYYPIPGRQPSYGSGSGYGYGYVQPYNPLYQPVQPSQPGQPGQPGQPQPEQFLIDNRAIADELESSASSDSIVSIPVSDSISIASSDDY